MHMWVVGWGIPVTRVSDMMVGAVNLILCHKGNPPGREVSLLVGG